MQRALILGLSALFLLAMGFAVARYAQPSGMARAATDAPVLNPTDDAMPMPPQADERTKEMRRFDRYDRDSDGRIIATEFLAARRKAFSRLDQNQDGVLSFDEYATKARDKFAKADKDKSQALDRTEFAATKPVRKAHAVKCPPVVQPANDAAVDASEG